MFGITASKLLDDIRVDMRDHRGLHLRASPQGDVHVKVHTRCGDETLTCREGGKQETSSPHEEGNSLGLRCLWSSAVQSDRQPVAISRRRPLLFWYLGRTSSQRHPLSLWPPDRCAAGLYTRAREKG